MQLVYHLTDAARKKIFVETGRDPGQIQVLEVDPAVLRVEQRELLAAWNPTLSDTLPLSYSDAGSVWGSTTNYLTRDQIATDPAELIASYHDARAAGAARLFAAEEERIAAEAEKIDREIAAFRAWNSERGPSILNTGLYQRSPRHEEWIAAHAAATARAKELAEQIAEQRRQDAARQEAEKVARLAERRAWALAHGSSRLRKCIEMEYDSQRLYVFERAAFERPGYVVDFDDKAAWKARSGPSEAALDEAARVGGEVVWLTRLPLDDGAPEDYQEGWEDEREAVVIRHYLGRYDLIKIV